MMHDQAMFSGSFDELDGDQLPLARVFAWLRERWLEQDEARTATDLARLIGITPQQVYNWTHTGAPMWGVLRVCAELGVGLVLEPTRIYTIRIGGEA